MKAKIGITDDHKLVAEGLSEVLGHYPDLNVRWTASNGGETIAACKTEVPDVLLLDINLPDMNGIKLCKQLLGKFQGLKVIGLSSFDEVQLVKQMTANGASGYLLKNTEGDELHKAILEVMNGRTYYQEEIREALMQHALGKRQKENFIPKLTRREQQILTLIAEELTTREIAQRLFLSEKTIESHRQNLIRKLGAKNSVGLIRTAIERGLI